MRDPFLTRDWADHHGELTAFVRDLYHQARAAFERLAARTYDAPWKAHTSRHRADDHRAPQNSDCPGA